MALVSHVSFLSSLRLGKEFVEILDSDKGPCEVVALSDAFDPGCLCEENGGAVEILSCWFDTGELVDIVNRFHCNQVDVVENFKVGEHSSCRVDGVEGIKRLGSGGSIK